jgi:hypothetical protein
MNKQLQIIPRLFFVFLAVFSQPVLLAAVKLHSAILIQGATMARYSNAPAYLHWSISNPDPEAATITLQLEPDSGSSDAIYSTRIRLGAKSKLEGRSPVSVGNSERYIVSLIQQNMRVDKTDVLIRSIQNNRLNVAILTDDDNIQGTGDVGKNERLYRKLQLSIMRHRHIPHHFNGFTIYDLLILHKPDLTLYSTFQKKAILDYVRMGGTLVISSAETAFSMYQAGLAELLPYHPLATLEYEGLTESGKALACLPQHCPCATSMGICSPSSGKLCLKL